MCDVGNETNFLVEESPCGTKYFIPNVEDSLKPKLGDLFDSVESAEKMYRRYAEHAGFDVRLSNKKENKDGKITARYFVCSKEGNPPSKMYDSLDANPTERRQRKSNIKRSGCFACFKVHYVNDRSKYELYKFVEKHNHMPFSKYEMSLSRPNVVLAMLIIGIFILRLRPK